jgi:hypothetical protein
MVALITRHFRVHEAIQFFESFSETTPTRYYFYIGKSFAYANAIPITGTVKTTSTSNNIIGQGTYFTTDLAVGDRIGITGQGTVVRVHAIPTAQTIIVTPRPDSTIVEGGANVYIRKLFSELEPPTPEDTYQDVYYDIWRNIIAMKRIQSSDVSHVAAKYIWNSGTVYTEFDDRDKNLYAKQFYVITGIDNNVYKCIDNNRGVPSTVKPTSTSVSDIQLTDDGYRWKYLFTVTQGLALRFMTNDFIPINTNNAVRSYASNGSIHHIKIIANGGGYLYTKNTISSIVNSTAYKIKSNASTIDGSYVGSSIYISSGAGSGQIRKIIKYYGANTTLVVNSAFTATPNTLSGYVISPTVTIRGDSGASPGIRATAYASNVSSGQIKTISIISQGKSYSIANVTISCNTVHGRGATARPVISPKGGHGYDPVDELYGYNVMMNVKTQGSESSIFPTNNDFRLIGVVRDPTDVSGTVLTTSLVDQTTKITVAEVNGDFIADEVITGRISRTKGRVVEFANTNASRTDGILKLIRITTNGNGGTFIPGEILDGASSTISANVQSVGTLPARPFSGVVIYNENRAPILRNPDQTEDYKITVRF